MQPSSEAQKSPKASTNKNAGSPVTQLQLLQQRVQESSYSIELRLELAQQYICLEYPDLGAGEAYKALLLVDELVDESGEYHDQALEAAKLTVALKDGAIRVARVEEDGELTARLQNCGSINTSIEVEVEEDECRCWASTWRLEAYSCLIESLAKCGCFESAFAFYRRGLQDPTLEPSLRRVHERLTRSMRSYSELRGLQWDEAKMDGDNYPEKGLVRRELYPWNMHEPDRFSAESLALLNEQMKAVAPKLEVRATVLPVLTTKAPSPNCSWLRFESVAKTVKQLGVFATEDANPGELILNETSLLTATGRAHAPFCDACSIPLPDSGSSYPTGLDGSQASAAVECAECEDVLFCSTQCSESAQTTYHAAICGKDVEAIARDVPAKDAADALYSLLLLRAFAMAETQMVHPLDLPEVKFIWGDYHQEPVLPEHLPPSEDTESSHGVPVILPFTFKANILMPLHMLEQMGINIFESTPKYDTWVINTLYAKFRGTASARQGRDGLPEVGAVHPLWCLANHSCDPNVRWDWNGSMKFWAREQRVAWKGKEHRSNAGVPKGQEILSHYCDIVLPVDQRRAWAVGALGGYCTCERCLWEDRVENETREKDQDQGSA